MTIVTANLPEISGRLYYDKLVENHPNLNWSCFDGLVIDIGFGTRYTSLQQSYTGNLTNTDASGASNTSARASTQSFKGLGFTSSLDFSLPIRQNWVMFTNLRGSVVVGENTETSSLNVNITGATPISNILTQTRTQFVPIGNIEVGTQCGFELGQSLRDGTRPPFVTLRLAVTGQVWGGVGPLSAGSPQGYTTNNLFLVGAHIMVVLNR